MTPDEFTELIDCKFPYDDPVAAKRLIGAARTISDAASFVVLEEICRPPQSASVAPERLLALVADWLEQTSHHPLAAQMAALVLRLRSGEELEDDEALRFCRVIAPFDGLYGALNIVYFGTRNVDGPVYDEVASISSRWQARGVAMAGLP